MIRNLVLAFSFITLGATLVLAQAANKFDHPSHLEYMDNPPCATCHLPGAKSIIPDTKICFDCHDQSQAKEFELPALTTHGPTWSLNHRQFAKGEFKFIDCSACHQQQDCMECHRSGFADEQNSFGNAMINVHRSDFHITHPIAARTDPRLCASCHESRFCSDCHNNFARTDLASFSHRKGFTAGTLGGAHALFNETQCQTCHVNSVLPSSEWSRQHAKEARKNLYTCQACHPQGDVCLKCHSARTGLKVNPHPQNWDRTKGRLERASGGKTCRQCH